MDLICMAQSATVVSRREDYALAVAPRGPFLRIFRDGPEETETDTCMRALGRLRCPEESKDALIDYSSRKFSQKQTRAEFVKEVISSAERVAGFKPGEAYRKRGAFERLLGDGARYEEDFYGSGEKYLALLHSDENIARFTGKAFLKFLKDTSDSRGVIGTYIDVISYHYRKSHPWTVAHMVRPELLAAAEPLKALCATGTEAVEAYLNAVGRCDNNVSGNDIEFARLTGNGCFEMMRKIGKEGGRFESYFAGRPDRYSSRDSETYRELCAALFSSYAMGEDVSAALRKVIEC